MQKYDKIIKVPNNYVIFNIIVAVSNYSANIVSSTR